MNTPIENARRFEQGMIDSISTLVDRVTEGDFSGRLYSKLIDGDPINSALNCIKEYHVANNSVMDESVLIKIQNEETRLVEVLLAKKEDPEIQNVIESIKKANTYGISTIEKINSAEKINNPLNVVSDSNFSILNLPNDVIKIVLVNGSVDDACAFFKVSKKTNEFANNEVLWKSFCLKEGEPEKGDYATWKDFYLKEIHLDSCRGNYEFSFSLKFNSNSEVQVNLEHKKLTLKKVKRIAIKTLNLGCKIDEIDLMAFLNVIPEYKDDTTWSSIVRDGQGKIEVIMRDDVRFKKQKIVDVVQKEEVDNGIVNAVQNEDTEIGHVVENSDEGNPNPCNKICLIM